MPGRRAGGGACFFSYIAHLIFLLNFLFNLFLLGLQSQEPIVTKLGPWGGNGGTAYDFTVAPHRLESVTVYSGVIVDVLEFSYIDHSGHQHNVGPWGGPWEGNDGHKVSV